MRRLLIVAALLSWSANLAFSQSGGNLAVKADPQTVCSYIFEPPPFQVLPLYIVHINHSGATGVRFSAPKPPCFNAVLIGETTPFIEIAGGNSQTGTTVYYGRCLPAPVVVLTMDFLVMGTSPLCCLYHVSPDPANPSNRIEASDCAGQTWWATERLGIINPILSCYDGICYPIPVEGTTWGHVKALFAE